MRCEWDPGKSAANRAKHGLSFEEAAELFGSRADYLEDRFVAVGRIRRANDSKSTRGEDMSDEIRELTDQDFARAIPRRQRERILRGRLAGGDDVIALRRFVGLTQQQFADALGISVHTLRNWEQGRRKPEGPALALLRVAARHPRVLRENLAAAV